MLINEVCKKCSLTKKAIEYYEKQGLVHPKVGENGYRNYCDTDLSILKEISVLRNLGLSIAEIKNVLSSRNKSFTLSKYKYLLDLKRQRIMEQERGLELLIENYNIDKCREFIDSNLTCSFTIKEKLVQSFPGTYGIYLSTHFGPFLNEKMDSTEKEKAYEKIVYFLDNIRMTKEMEEILATIIPLMEQEDLEKVNTSFLNAMDDTESYLAANQQSIEKYISFRQSEEYKSTPAYKIQQLLVEFQRTSGYNEIFIENMKILSPSYLEYSEKLQEANKRLIEKYPETAMFYPKD